MKKTNALLALLPFALFACGNPTTIKETVIEDTQIRFCESTYPLDDALLVANFGTEQLNPLNQEGKGYIVRVVADKVEMFIPADGHLSAPKGMCEEDDHLFICDVNKIVVYNLKNLAAAPQTIRFPEDDLFINDLCMENDQLYVTVTNTGRIYRLNVADVTRMEGAQPELFCTVPGANGIIEENGTLYVASYPPDGNTTPDNVIYKVTNLTQPLVEKLSTTPGQYDGIAIDADKQKLYVTSWVPAGLFEVDLLTGVTTPITLVTPLVGAADMTLEDHTLYIPDLPNSRVVKVTLPSAKK